MTNEEMIQDFKQFIEATVSQAEHRLEAQMATKDDIKELRRELKVLDEKVDTIQDAIADTLTRTTETTDATLENHEMRLQRLEQRAA